MKIELTKLHYLNPDGIRLAKITINRNDVIFYWEDGYRTTTELLHMRYDDCLMEIQLNCRYRDSTFLLTIGISTGFCEVSNHPVTYVV